MKDLTDTELAMLDLESTWWKHPGAKEARIRELFDWSATRYYQRLLELIDRPEALEHDPLLVKRLQRQRAARARQRAAARLHG